MEKESPAITIERLALLSDARHYLARIKESLQDLQTSSEMILDIADQLEDDKLQQQIRELRLTTVSDIGEKLHLTMQRYQDSYRSLLQDNTVQAGEFQVIEYLVKDECWHGVKEVTQNIYATFGKNRTYLTDSEVGTILNKLFALGLIDRNDKGQVRATLEAFEKFSKRGGPNTSGTRTFTA
jgi:predicted nuclease with TOPRIM domain